MDQLGDLNVHRPRTARTVDPVQILTLAGSVVALINGLLELKERLSRLPSWPKVVVRTEQGEQLTLADANQDAISRIVSNAPQAQ
jgi:hypothetical protein